MQEEQANKVSNYVRNSVENLGVKNKIDIRQTIEGIELVLKDPNKKSMFVESTDILTKDARETVLKATEIVSFLPHYIAITGHSRDVRLKGLGEVISEYEISTSRANSVRRLMISNGVPKEQVSKVVGKGNNKPLNEANFLSEENDYISILLIRESVQPYFKKAAPDTFFHRFFEGDEGE